MDKEHPQDTFGERIKLIEFEMGGRKVLVEKSGVSQSQLSRYSRDESQPTVDPLVAIANAGGYSIEWLASGKGPKKAGEQRNDKGAVAIDFYPDIQPAAGCGNHIISEKSVPILFDSDYLTDVVRVAPRHCVLFTASGDSMAPTIASGDLLVVDRSVTRGDDIFVLRLNEDIMVKRLQFLPTGEIEVISDCPAYKNYTLRQDQPHDLQIIGRVAWHGGRC